MSEVKPANPAPLGLLGFGVTTLVLSAWNGGLLKGADVLIVIGLAVFYGGLAQFCAGMWEFRAGNTFGAAAFTSYGAFWLSFAALLIPGFGIAFGSKTGPSSDALGWYLVGWAIVTGIFMLGTFRLNGGLALVFILLFITYILLAVGAFDGQGAGVGLTQIGGYTGILTAIAAFYVALAAIMSAVSNDKIRLPVIPLS